MRWGTKNPPNKKGRYLVTIKDNFGRTVRQADRAEHGGNWYWYILPSYSVSYDVVAWIKQPEPYSGG